MKTAKRIICVLIFMFAILQSGFSATVGETPSIGVMSYNVRYDTEKDGINRWDARKEWVAAVIGFHEPGFVGIQEGWPHQLEYLSNALGTYTWIGVSREGKNKPGEFAAIFYDTQRFELIEDSEQTIWLSETPRKPGKSWDAALPRILTFGKFRDKESSREFWVYNTHFDHKGHAARVESARVVVETIKKISGQEPVILTGDFNMTEAEEPYKILTAPDSSLKDAFYSTESAHVGPLFTFEGFEVKSGRKQRRIDYIFVNPQVQARKHAILSHFRDGRYPSDHLPVFAVVTLGD